LVRRTLLATAALALVIFVGCGDSSSSGTTGDGVPVTLREYAVSVGETSVAAGDVKFRIDNEGKLEHELVVFRTDLAPDALPMSGNRVDESGAGITHLDPEAEGIHPDSVADLTVALTPGHYVLICNLPDHYTAGMRASLDVTA
jgi:uncharacterized cupredoxin-like copper-binding protein